MLLHTDAFDFDTQILLHTKAFRHRCFYTQTLLHTFTHRHLHAHPAAFHTQTPHYCRQTCFFPSNARWLSPGRLSKAFTRTLLLFSRIWPMSHGSVPTSISSKTSLYKDPKSPTMQANHNKPKTTQNSRTTRKFPSQICVSPRGKANQTHCT